MPGLDAMSDGQNDQAQPLTEGVPACDRPSEVTCDTEAFELLFALTVVT